MAPALKNTMFGKYFKHVLVLTLLAGIAYPLPQVKEAMAGAFAINTVAASDAVVFLARKTTDASASVTSSKLVLSYDRKRSESALDATAEIVVNGGAKGVNVYREGTTPVFSDAKNPTSHAGSQSVSPLTPTSKLKTLRDESGMLMYVVPANKKVIFKAASQANPQKMFAGTYYASVEYIYLNKGTARDTVVALTLPANKTNKVTVVGEKSPYITSVSSPVEVGGKFAIYGQRLWLGDSKVFVDGKQIDSSVLVDGSKDGSVLFFVIPSSFTVGQHNVYVSSTRYGRSNAMAFAVGGITPVVCPAGYVCEPVPPTVPQIPDCPKGYTCSPAVIGSVHVSLDLSTPDESTILADAKDVTFAVVRLHASTTDITNLNGIHIASDSVDVGSKIKNIRVYDGSTVIGTVSSLTYNGSYYYGWVYNTDIIIPAHSSRSLRIVADINPSVAGVIRLGIGGLNFDAPGAYVDGLPLYGSNIEVLESALPQVTFVSAETDATTGTSANDDVGMFTIKYKVTAVGGNVYIASTTASHIYRVDRNGAPVVSSALSAAVVNNTDSTLTAKGNYVIEEGESDTFTLYISAPLPAIGTSGQYRAALVGIKWDSVDTAVPAKILTSGFESFVTDYKVLN